MRYQLTNGFQQVQEKSGIIQNLHNDAIVEFVTVREGSPKVGDGILIRSNEKIQFSLEESQKAYVRNIRPRCESIPIVVTEVFKKPASSEGAGYKRVVLFEGYAAASTTETPSKLTLAGAADEYDYLIISAIYAQPFNLIMPRESPSTVASATFGTQNCFCYIGRSGNMIAQSYCYLGVWAANGRNTGITRVIGVKGV